MNKIGIVILIVATFSSQASAAGRVDCGSITSRFAGPSVNYCALLPESYDREPGRRFPVIYFLHGLGADSRTLVTTGAWDLIENLHARKLLGAFVVITPDADRSFYINAKDGGIKYEDFFLHEFIPAMEKKFRAGGSRERRALAGISMGGYGALRFAFRYPREFEAVAVHSAALVAKMPPGIAATNIGYYMGDAFGHPPDPVYWERESPLTLARVSDLRGLKIYFDCGAEDDFGFERGAAHLHQLLNVRGVAHEFHIYPGRHGWSYAARHLPASLEFLSRTFPNK